MSDHLVYERYVWFDRQLRKNTYPNATTLSCHFEIDPKTAQRNIAKMRDFIGAPFEYDASRKGYYYLEDSFRLPQLPVSQNELLAVLLAQNLLTRSAGGVISREIAAFGRKLLATVGEMGVDQNRLRHGFSAAWSGYTPADGKTFQAVATALLQSRTLHCRHYSPPKDQFSERSVDPYHLKHYNGSWMLIAWCHLREQFLTFSLSRLDRLQLTQHCFVPRPQTQWQHLIEESFGIFQGDEKQEVLLRFSPYRARWISKEKWHPGQQIETGPDGSLRMRLLVADFREIKLRILQYGADVEVLAPASLRAEIEVEIGRMQEIYKSS